MLKIFTECLNLLGHPKLEGVTSLNSDDYHGYARNTTTLPIRLFDSVCVCALVALHERPSETRRFVQV